MVFLPRMATEDSSDSEITCLEKMVFSEGLETVFGAVGIKAADVPISKEGLKDNLIKFNKKYGYFVHIFDISSEISLDKSVYCAFSASFLA